MKTSEILRAAKALIEDPAHWVQGTYGRQTRESTEHLLGDDPRTTCWCSVGAIQKVMGMYHEYTTEALLDKVSKNLHGVGIINFNDRATTTHAQVMEVWDAAIAKAEAEEASE
jgi:hypothetical protein